MATKFPVRLGYGKGFIGRDFPGCCNAGAPTMFKSRAADIYLSKPFAVGQVAEVRYNLSDNISKAMAGKPTPYVKFYATYSAAKKEFERLQAIVDQSYAEISQAQRELKANPLNFNAALTLSDNGVL